MHELSVVFSVIDDLKELGEQQNLTQISSVTLELGEVSTVIPAYLKDCWKWAVDRTELLKGADLQIDRIKAKTWCEDCHTEYETVKYGKICPNCGSGHTFLLQGNEFIIKSIVAS